MKQSSPSFFPLFSMALMYVLLVSVEHDHHRCNDVLVGNFLISHDVLWKP